MPGSSDFIVGDEDLSLLEIRDGGSGNGFFYFFIRDEHRLIKRFILYTSKTGIKTCCDVTFIKKDEKFTPRFCFSKRELEKIEKALTQASEEERLITARVSLEDCYQNFWNLIEYVRSLKQVDVPQNGLTVVTSKDKELFTEFYSKRNFIEKILSEFTTPESEQLLMDAKKENINDLYAAIKHAKNKKALNEIDGLIINESSEHILEAWIKENDWVFGVEYVRTLDATKIGIHSEADLLVESLDGFVDIIELKKASAGRLFIHDKSHNCYFPSAILSQVIGQTIHYLGIMEDQRLHLKSEDGLNILRPRAKIVIGLSSVLEVGEKEALRKLNDTLHNIEILTYDEIKYRARRIVEEYGRHV
jgi:hypothetical protein